MKILQELWEILRDEWDGAAVAGVIGAVIGVAFSWRFSAGVGWVLFFMLLAVVLFALILWAGEKLAIEP